MLWSPLEDSSNFESRHYKPLCRLLNKCVEACHTALGHSKGEYYRTLKFVKWDYPTQDGCGEPCLKPDLAGGLNLRERNKIKANRELYWRRPSSNEHELLIPVEVKKGVERFGLSSRGICALSFHGQPFTQIRIAYWIRVRTTAIPDLTLPPRRSYFVTSFKARCQKRYKWPPSYFFCNLVMEHGRRCRPSPLVQWQ